MVQRTSGKVFSVNRQQRRLEEKRKARKPNRSSAIYTTNFQLEFESFDSIERLFANIRNGSLEYQQGEGWVIMGLSGEYLHVLSALEGWMDYWTEITNEQEIPYNDVALRKFGKSLEYEKPLNMLEVNAAYEIVKLQRQLYRALPKSVTTRTARNIMARNKMNDEIKSLIRVA